ncbi:triacylglycerol lipase, partial [Streptomyces sp. NPDC004266]
MAAIGVACGYDIDIKPYLSEKGLKVFNELEHGSITDALGHYPGMTWTDLVKPGYENPNSIPAFAEAINNVNLGQAATPAGRTRAGSRERSTPRRA